MGTLHRKVLMMDAGTALFTGAAGFGDAIGRVKAEMDVFGKTRHVADLRPEDLPAAVRDCDLFLDASTPWRIRYIACKVEDAGSTGRTDAGDREIRRYAAVFTEGNKSSVLRNAAFLLAAFSILAGIALLPYPWYSDVAGAVLVLVVLLAALRPSRNALLTVRHIQETLREGQSS